MSERSNLIHRLCESIDSRTAYIKSKLGVLVPSQIRALRMRSEMPRQADLARASGLHQSRISMFETPGAANMTLETLARLAAAFKVGLLVKFVPFSEMLRSENEYSQDNFYVTPIHRDHEFLEPSSRSSVPHNALELLYSAAPNRLSNGASGAEFVETQRASIDGQNRPSMLSISTQHEHNEMAQTA